MGELYLVRHAQAAFGTDDYDRLTDLGHRQAGWLGEYFAEREMRFDRVLSGTLRRHRETVSGIARHAAEFPAAQIEPGLDEYDPQRLVASHQGARASDRAEPIPARSPMAGTPAHGSADESTDATSTRKAHFRLLREALEAWTRGEIDPATHRSFEQFQRDAYRAFELAWQAERSDARRVLIVSSGGPISSIVARHLGMPPTGFVALNLQIRNSGFCEIRFNARGARLISFNNVPHLDTPARRRHITFS